MEWLNRLHGKTIGVDTAPFIYFVEEHPAYLPMVDPFFQALERGEIQAVTSTLALTEVLVHPYRRGDRDLARQYSNILLNAPNLRTIALSPEIAEEAARIRAVYGLKTPDSILLATSRLAGASAFLTNDEEIAQLPDMETVVLSRLITQP